MSTGRVGLLFLHIRKEIGDSNSRFQDGFMAARNAPARLRSVRTANRRRLSTCRSIKDQAKRFSVNKRAMNSSCRPARVFHAENLLLRNCENALPQKGIIRDTALVKQREADSWRESSPKLEDCAHTEQPMAISGTRNRPSFDGRNDRLGTTRPNIPP